MPTPRKKAAKKTVRKSVAKKAVKKVAKKAVKKVAKKTTNKAAKKKVPVPVAPSNSERETTVRKIENGYIVRQSWYDKKGRYNTKEKFSQTNPLKV